MGQASDTYQKMFSQVEEIIQNMENGTMDLDQMIREVKKGQKLIVKMNDRLQESKNTIENLKKDLEISASRSVSNPDSDDRDSL